MIINTRILTWSKLLHKDQLLARDIEDDNRHRVVHLQQVPVLLLPILRVVEPERLYVRRIRRQWTVVDVGDVLHGAGTRGEQLAAAD